MGYGKRSLERRDVTAVSLEPCSKSACFYAFSSPCSPLLAQIFDVFHDEKTTLFRHTSSSKSANRLLGRRRASRSDWSHIIAEEKERRSSGARISTDFKKQRLRLIIVQAYTNFKLLSAPIQPGNGATAATLRVNQAQRSTKSSSHTRHQSRAITPLDRGYATRQRL
jgi:hypothetical protein